ncbi:MAG: TetR/AcrR family transcriptional regulator [Bifidobacteriaceae bacterium]|nr:TetR/AcrR family transcriptional regulator [Bifidobacteriaceae bacterium]
MTEFSQRGSLATPKPEGGTELTRTTKPVVERRREIIATARELFSEHGFDKTQVGDISKKMGTAQGLIYHYFKSKTEILYAVIDELADEGVEGFRAVLADTDSTALERLNVFLSSHSKPDGFGQLIPSIADEPAIAEYCSNKFTTATRPIVVELIGQGNSDGSWACQYPEETATFILQGFSGFFKQTPPVVVGPELRAALADILIRVLGCPAPKSPDKG